MGILDAPGLSPRAATAARCLSFVRRPYDVGQIHPSPPTMTLSAASAATSISGGIRIAPKRASASLIDVAGDPHFEYVGQRPDKLTVANTDTARPDHLTNGSSQAARDRSRLRFVHTGSVIEFAQRMPGATFRYRLLVDGMPCTTNMVQESVTASSRYMLKADFGSRATRVIELEVEDPQWIGVLVEPSATVVRTRQGRPLIAALGDSVTGGANGISGYDSWVRYAAGLLGMDWINSGIGGSGYLAAAAQNSLFRTRVADVASLQPDVLVVFGGFNDITPFTTQEITDEAAYVLAALRAAMPATAIVVVGPWINSAGTAAWPAGVAADNAIKGVAGALGMPFTSLFDPTGLAATAPAWAPSTAYVHGDVVAANGWAQKAIASHTSGASFAQTNWRPLTFVNGTGRVGATTGVGNADTMISSDGVHPTVEGMRTLGGYLAGEIAAALRTLAP